MKKTLGISLFLLVLYIILRTLPGGASADNHRELGQEIGLYGLLSLGAGLLIISGGIDLSMGSLFAMCGVLFSIFVVDWKWSLWGALGVILLIGAAIGWLHGLIITKLRIQAFVVTLCGLFIYRGLARFFSGERSRGLGGLFIDERAFFNSDLAGVPVYLWILFVFAGAALVVLHFSVHGRCLVAIGSNEKAAQYSGIATDRYKIAAYMLCSTLTALFSFLFLMKYPSILPNNTGSMFELYAIAGAVLGGCSLRGGEGTVVGILVGTCIIRLLPNMLNMSGNVGVSVEFVVIGAALLLGALLDEALRRGVFRTGWLAKSGLALMLAPFFDLVLMLLLGGRVVPSLFLEPPLVDALAWSLILHWIPGIVLLVADARMRAGASRAWTMMGCLTAIIGGGLLLVLTVVTLVTFWNQDEMVLAAFIPIVANVLAATFTMSAGVWTWRHQHAA